MSHDPKEWCKIWIKTDLLFQKLQDEFGKLWPKHSKVSKVHWFLLCKLLMFDLKKYKGVIFHDTDAKFEEKLTCGLKNDIGNLANFHQSPRKCQNWNFGGVLMSKVENAWA